MKNHLNLIVISVAHSQNIVVFMKAVSTEAPKRPTHVQANTRWQDRTKAGSNQMVASLILKVHEGENQCDAKGMRGEQLEGLLEEFFTRRPAMPFRPSISCVESPQAVEGEHFHMRVA